MNAISENPCTCTGGAEGGGVSRYRVEQVKVIVDSRHYYQVTQRARVGPVLVVAVGLLVHGAAHDGGEVEDGGEQVEDLAVHAEVHVPQPAPAPRRRRLLAAHADGRGHPVEHGDAQGQAVQVL